MFAIPMALSAEVWQVIGVGIAAFAALASWAAVIVALRAAGDARDAERESREVARESEREARRPRLLLSPAFNTSGPVAPTMTLAVHNAGGGIAQNVGLILVTRDTVARYGLGFLLPGETIHFGSDVDADENHRAVAYGRSADGEGLGWNIVGERRILDSAPSDLPTFPEAFAAFYPGEDLEAGRRLGRLFLG